jgi:hypothetical protein
MSDPVKSLSDAIIEPITKAYRVGGFGLAFLLLGALMILFGALVSGKIFVYPLALVGLLLVLIPCYFFYTKEVRPISMARKSTVRNSEVIDTVQSTAIELTNLTLDVQALAFKHADSIVQVMKIVRPQVRIIPRIGKPIDSLLSRPDELAKSIVSGTEVIRSVVGDINLALISSDVTQLRGYLQEIKKLEAQVQAMLASPIMDSGEQDR